MCSCHGNVDISLPASLVGSVATFMCSGGFREGGGGGVKTPLPSALLLARLIGVKISWSFGNGHHTQNLYFSRRAVPHAELCITINCAHARI